MIKTEFHGSDFHKGDRVVLVNDYLDDCDRAADLIPGVEGVVIGKHPVKRDERICVNWNVSPTYLHSWWVNPWDIRPADFAQIDASDISSLL